jgi:tryptophan halogenase
MRIVIVGGGTAGWLTAIIGLATSPEHTYTVLESSQIGIIGVGESTTGFFTDLFQDDLRSMGVDHDDFMIKTGATCKLGIRHRGWGKDITRSYLAPLDGSSTQFDSRDSAFEFALKQLPREDLITISHTGFLMKHGLSNMDRTGRFTRHGHALHVDGTLTGQYFKKHCLQQENCHHIDNELVSVNIGEDSLISSIQLADGSQLEGDLFIDCTGFSRLLIKAMGAKWVSYKQWLPVDRGMPFLEKYSADELPEAWTTAHAQNNGWMWTTPLLDRKGNGYVYSSDHVTDEQAQDEIEIALGRKITPVKIVKFDAGRQDQAWIGNCISIGLSSSFLEPLEATSIHTSIVQIKMLFKEYICATKEQTLNPGIIKTYNQRWGKQIDDLKDFLVMHYQGGRTDTEFWKYITSGATQTDLVKTLMDMARVRTLSYNDFPRYWGVAGWSLYSWVMAGLGLFDNLPANDNPELLFDQEISYLELQQHMAQLYGNNLTHAEYINFIQAKRQKLI